MLKTITLLALLAIMILPAGMSFAQEAGDQENTTWILQTLNGEAVPEGVEVTALVADGHISGSAGCNNYSASITIDGNNISIGPAATTRMMCPDPQMQVEDAYLMALGAAATFTATGDQLEIFDAGGNSILVFGTSGATQAENQVWVLTEMNGTPVPQGVQITLAVVGDRISGSSGCNNYNGTVTIDGNSVTVGPLMGTMMACPPPLMELEMAYQGALGSAASFQIVGDTLEVYDVNGVKVLAFSVKQPAELEGTSWKLFGIANVSSGEYEVVTLAFQDGMAGGYSGCNNYSGSYEVSGSNITFGPMMSTMMACPQEQMELEMKFMSALQSVVSFEINNHGNLELLDATGRRALAFAPNIPQPLAGTSWQLEWLRNVASVDHHKVTAAFTEDQIGGNSGCNSYSGSYQISGSDITISPNIAVTMMACPDAETQLEQDYLQALTEARTFGFANDMLEMYGEDGRRILGYTSVQ